MKEQKKDVIVIGHNYTTILGVVRCVGEAGYGVRLLALDKYGVMISSKSKYVKSCIQIRTDWDVLYKALEEIRGEDDRLLIIPAQDWVCLALSQHAETLKQHYDFPCVRGNEYDLAYLMNKAVQKQMAIECGVPVAKGKGFPTTKEGIDDAVCQAEYPCFVKPAVSAAARGSKDLIVCCHNREELKTAIEDIAESGCPLAVVERYLNIKQELSAYGFVQGGKAKIPAYIAAETNGSGINKGIAATGKVFSADLLGELKPKLEQLAEKTGLEGLFCMDLLDCDDGIFFSEINVRCGASEYAVAEAGSNLPGAYLASHFNGEYADSFRIESNTAYVNEKVVLDALRGGYISFHEYRNALKRCRYHIVKNAQDPKPWIQYKILELKKIAALLLRGPRD